MTLKEDAPTTTVGSSETTGSPIAGLDGTIGPKRRRNTKKTMRFFHRRTPFSEVYYNDKQLLAESQEIQILLQNLDQIQTVLSMVDWQTLMMHTGKYLPTSGETISTTFDTIRELPQRLKDVRDNLSYRVRKRREREAKQQAKQQAQKREMPPAYVPMSVVAAGPVKQSKRFAKKRLRLKESSVVFDIPSENWMKCIQGKPKYKHFKTFVGAGDVAKEISKFSRSKRKSNIVVRDKTTSAHTYLRKHK